MNNNSTYFVLFSAKLRLGFFGKRFAVDIVSWNPQFNVIRSQGILCSDDEST